ncbi:MAG: NAD-dependent epimerase/dehydratase family protein [bacterium]
MNVLVTGGAGFIGRWVVAAFLGDTPHRVCVLDDFSNSTRLNLREFENEPRLSAVVKGTVESGKTLDRVFESFRPELCVHLAARINVQDSIDGPAATFRSDVTGTYLLLERCRPGKIPFVFMSTCMVYDRAAGSAGITERHPALPRSPYAAAKLAGEHLVISWFHAYRLPAVVLRPFNTYGPFQKTSGEGGVVSIFLHRQMTGRDLEIFGGGNQTRDLLYVEDCAEFVLRCSLSKKGRGEVFNAATGRDVTIARLARLVLESAPEKTASRIRRVAHPHPQSEIMKLRGNARRAADVFGWKPATPLESGIAKTREWLARASSGAGKRQG